MNYEEKANTPIPMKPKSSPLEQDDRSDSDLVEKLQRLEAELASGQDEEEEPALEQVPMTDEQMNALSDEELKEHIEILEEQVELDKKRREVDLRALKLGMLAVANRAPRCSHLKSSGEPCRAPAMGNRLFCVFHTRAFDTDDTPRIEVKVLEDRESLQLTVKQIMEQIVRGRIEPETASLLLRAVQIANSTLNPKVRGARRNPKSTREEPDDMLGNAEEISA